MLGALLHRRSGGRPPPARATRRRALTRQPSAYDAGGGHRRAMLSKKYSYIPDTYTSLDEVRAGADRCIIACKLQTDKASKQASRAAR